MTEPRKITLRLIRETLKQHDRPLSDEELANILGCSPVTIKNNVYRWVQQAAGVRCVRQGPKQYLGWSYMPPEECDPYEPATPTIEQLEQRIRELESQARTPDIPK